MNQYEVLKRPVVTEKSSLQTDYANRYTFEVDVRANKMQIKDAVEQTFNVHVVSVNVMNVDGKKRRLGRRMGKTPDWKKAIVTLVQGETIEFFQGV